MTDLTKLTTAFGLLDAETQQALRDWPHGVEIYNRGNDWSRIVFPFAPSWDDSSVYRARPAPVTKPSIDWSHVAEGWNWLAVDGDGEAYLFNGKPEMRDGSWIYGWDDLQLTTVFASHRPGTCRWQDSLICRPGFEVME